MEEKVGGGRMGVDMQEAAKCIMHLFFSHISKSFQTIFIRWDVCVHVESGIAEYIRIYNISEEENDCYSTLYSQFLLH